MKALARCLGVAGLAFMLAGPTQAGTEAACAALTTARMKLLAMVDGRDRAELDALKREVYAASAALEGEVGALAGADGARAMAFRRIWEPFKRTREQEIIPALYRGQYARARALAHGVQAERYAQMRAALGCE